MTTARRRQHERGTDRLTAFSDGVVALLLLIPAQLIGGRIVRRRSGPPAAAGQ